MNFKELLNSKTPPKKDDLTDDDLARLFIKYKGLLKKLERDEAFWLATNENIKKAYLKLDELVEERTIELKIVNDQLQRELIERKKAETDLRKIAHQWQTTFDAMSESVFLLDIEKKFLQCNKATLDVLGKEKYDEIIGYSCYEIIHGINEPVEWCPMVRMIESGHKESSIAQIGDRWCDISVDPVINDEGTIIGAVHIIIDITERKKSEQELKESEENYRETYNRAEFYKDIFAHDINNILQSILSGTQISQLILDNPKKIDELKINAEIIKEQVIRGAKLVSNVRKLSKLEEAGRSLEKIEILKVLKNTVSFLKKSYKDKNLAIRVDSFGEKLFIKANIFLEDVFENVLINAIRHNRNLLLDITVRISRERRVGINYLKMEFLDNGFGVADFMKEKIFQRGYSKEKGVYGMGLGLSLVRGIIETYNGKIWVEDRVKGDRSKGSNFVLLIPEVD